MSDTIEVRVTVRQRDEHYNTKSEWSCQHVYDPAVLEQFRGNPAAPVKVDFERDIPTLVEKVLGVK
jgi:5-hydroxyisourate hydrolase-like protein (transthyretin family)